ncbi:MAG: hypothetical protein QJR13_09520 [Bacillota bacterium]|nr:hypothetical protein [Bacillota bacterium]
MAYASFWPERAQRCFSVLADGSQYNNPQRLTSGTGYEDYSPAFAPQGGLLAFVTNREGARTWSVYFFDPADPARLYRTWTSPDESWNPTVTGLRWYP